MKICNIGYDDITSYNRIKTNQEKGKIDITSFLYFGLFEIS